MVDLMADKIDDPKVSVEELKKVVAAKMEQLSSIESKQRNKESEGGASFSQARERGLIGATEPSPTANNYEKQHEI
ncbi:hypothetical protein GUI99_01760 [Enterococcus hirae]|uniref:hypothetical protein n=2 Tax=Enterococcus TaxID=1350 RepID=UPI0013691478|nr:hypothetical protein [Enterococcus hirae]NAB74230.1 hypothetical protein [Enterococcus hirae]NAD41708.1 hypothetical protein [Enterococcus hirae]NAD54520.1 hypothetical protein [Enterococcus hirae]NAD66422.1 hypothetical protein [Enterococcus hirae]NAD83333.1 hypothetical protein [Enterococcus hirae]